MLWVGLELKLRNELKRAYVSSSGSFLSAFVAIHWKAASTLVPSFAEVSQYGIFPFEAHHAFAFFLETYNHKAQTRINISCNVLRNNIIQHKRKANLVTYHSTIAAINIYFVTEHNKWKVVRIGWTRLYTTSINLFLHMARKVLKIIIRMVKSTIT